MISMKQLIYVFIVSFSIVGCIFVIIPKQYFCINNQLNNNNNEIINGAHHVDDNNNIFKTISNLKIDISSNIKNKSMEQKSSPLSKQQEQNSNNNNNYKKLSDYEKAKEYLNRPNSVRYMNQELLKMENHDDKQTILLFTFCIPGHGAEIKHGNPGILCNTWWETIEAWYNNIKDEEHANGLQIAMVQSNKNYNFIDSKRSPHWLKIIFLYTFLETEKYSTVIFIDADSVVRIPKWNVNKFINETMFSHVKLMVSQDANDFISTGEIFAKRDITPFLKDWYTNAEKFYGRLFLPHETYLGKLKVNNGMSGKIENFAAYKKIKYFWANGKKWFDHGEYTEPLNMVKENAPIQRCWGTLPTHEQGCFAHVFNAYGKKYSMHVKVMKSQEMHSFRLIKQHPPPLWRPIPTTPFLHYCCAKYAERVDGLNKCKELLRKGEAC